jgi:hypothetical protein
MAIWRGVGGPGDATGDAANQSVIAAAKAEEAALSADAAASSASAASTSATNAATSASAAATSESNAATSEGNASTSETNAASSATSASTSATNAATSETNAATSATNASTSATNAANSATSASTSATNAATSATNASTSESNAATSATNAAASYDSFDDRYLGAKSSAPTVDNDGDALLTGALYFNSTSNELYVWDGSAWDQATLSASSFATAAQGTLADSAVQPGDNVSTLTNDAGYLTSFTETNDLTAAVTWANVPDANITQSSVTQHQAALSITESQISDLGTYVTKTSATGSAEVPSGTTAQRDGTPAAGYLRFNTTDSSFEGYDGSAWGAIGGGGGASGGGSDAIFYENGQTITTSYTITSNTNAMSTGPLTVNSGVSVTVPSGSRWVVL